MSSNFSQFNFQTLYSQTQNLANEYKTSTDSNYKDALKIVINYKVSTLQDVVTSGSANQLRMISSISIS
jgi:hypothetical protein